MKIVVLDGHTENPGDLSWDALVQLGELVVYDRTSLTDGPKLSPASAMPMWPSPTKPPSLKLSSMPAPT